MRYESNGWHENEYFMMFFFFYVSYPRDSLLSLFLVLVSSLLFCQFRLPVFRHKYTSFLSLHLSLCDMFTLVGF